MSIANSYDSKINKLFNLSNIIIQVKKACLTGRAHKYSDDILFITEDMQNVEPFIHPIYDKESDKCYIDARPFTSIERDGKLKTRNILDYDLSVLRAQLELTWCRSPSRDDIFDSLPYSTEIFVRWLSDTIAHRHGLSPIQKGKVLALCAMYSIGLYFNNINNDTIVNRYLQRIAQNYPVSIDAVFDVAERIENQFPRDIDEFVACLGKLEVSPRLNDFSAVTMYNMLGGSWFGNSSSPQILSLALEYPPCFAALVKMAIDNTMYKRTSIGNIVFNNSRQNSHTIYSKALRMTIERYTD